MTDKLSRREREILDILYQRERCSARDVQEGLSGEPNYSTVRALLARMLDKGLVNSHRNGHILEYEPANPIGKVRRSALQRLVTTFFGGSRVKAATALLKDESLSDKELQELQVLIDNARSREEQ